MNNQRRSKIEKAVAELERIRGILDDLCTEEQESYDNMPENFQMSDRGDESQEAISALEEASASIDDAIDRLGDID